MSPTHVRPVLNLNGRFRCLDVDTCAGPVMSALVVTGGGVGEVEGRVLIFFPFECW